MLHPFPAHMVPLTPHSPEDGLWLLVPNQVLPHLWFNSALPSSVLPLHIHPMG